MPARCRIVGTTSTPRLLPDLCRKKDAPKASGTRLRNNCFSQIFSPGRTPATLHKAPCSCLSQRSRLLPDFSSHLSQRGLHHVQKKKEHHGKKYSPELYTPADCRLGRGRHYSACSLFNCMGTNAH